MEPVTLIISALVAGAAAAGKDVGKQAVKDAYNGLKSIIKKWFSKKENADGELALEKHEHDPETWEKPLKKSLSETGAAKASEIFDAVKALKQALESTPEGQRVLSKYSLNIKDSEIGIIGDNAKVEGGIHFGDSKK